MALKVSLVLYSKENADSRNALKVLFFYGRKTALNSSCGAYIKTKGLSTISDD